MGSWLLARYHRGRNPQQRMAGLHLRGLPTVNAVVVAGLRAASRPARWMGLPVVVGGGARCRRGHLGAALARDVSANGGFGGVLANLEDAIRAPGAWTEHVENHNDAGDDDPSSVFAPMLDGNHPLGATTFIVARASAVTLRRPGQSSPRTPGCADPAPRKDRRTRPGATRAATPPRFVPVSAACRESACPAHAQPHCRLPRR